MTTDPTVILTDILDIVNYSQDKETFINQFSETCMKKGYSDIENLLSEDKKVELASALLEKQTEGDLQKIICEFISEDQYKKAIQRATGDLLFDFLQSIEPTLTPEQSNNLDNYLSSL
jgi:hypothetical protein